MTRNSDNTGNTREKIFAAAVDLFSKKGFSGVSVREITRAVGINEASLYNHFANKEALLRAIVDYFRTISESALYPENQISELIQSLGPFGFLQDALSIYAQSMSDPLIIKIASIITIEQFSNDEVRDLLENEIVSKPRTFYTKAFTHMIERNLIKPLEPSLIADEYLLFSVGVYYEYAILKRGNFQMQELVQLAQRHIDFFWNMIKL